MSKRRKVNGLEFHVEDEGKLGDAHVFALFEDASSFAIARAVSHGKPVKLDVVIYSKAAARAWGGDDAVDVYEDDPEASVHERIIVRAESQGRIP